MEKGDSNIAKYQKRTIQMIGSAIRDGLTALNRETGHPQSTISRYVDTEKVQLYTQEAIKNLPYDNPKKLDPKIKELKRETRERAYRGEFLAEEGKERILDYALGQEAGDLFRGRKARRTLKNISDIRKTAELAREVYKIAEEHDIRSEEFYKDAEALKKLGFVEAVASYGYNRGFLTKNQYYEMISKAKQKVSSRGKKIEGHLESMLQQVAIIIGIVGLALLIFSNSITGNIIGITKTNLTGLIIGLLMIFISFLLICRKKIFK